MSGREDRHLIAAYCRFSNDDRLDPSTGDFGTFPKKVLNRIEKAREVFTRLSASHADDAFIKVLLFGQQPSAALKVYAASLGMPEDRIEVDTGCRNIADMARKVWDRISTQASTDQMRVYFVLSNWQWVYVEPMLKLKDDRFRFFFEGALDERSIDEITAEKRLEKVASVGMKEGRLAGILDKVGGNISDNLKG